MLIRVYLNLGCRARVNTLVEVRHMPLDTCISFVLYISKESVCMFLKPYV